MTTPPEAAERIIELSLQHPAWGCNQLDHWLQLEGIDARAITIQKMLNRREMGLRYHRWLMLERRHSEKTIELTTEQVMFLEKQNQAFRERHVDSSRPGELLCQDTFTVGSIKGIGRICLHALVDTYSSYAFGLLFTTKRLVAAVAVLHNDERPFYQERAIPVSAVLTDNGREFCGIDAHPYETYLALNDIEHRRTKVGKPWTNGYVERFNGTVLDVFMRGAFRTKFYASVEELQADFGQ